MLQGFGVWGSGFRVLGLVGRSDCIVKGLEVEVWVWGVGFSLSIYGLGG